MKIELSCKQSAKAIFLTQLTCSSLFPGSTVYVLSALCTHSRNTEHYKEKVLPAIQLTLKNLQLDYVDLYLVCHLLVFSFSLYRLINYLNYFLIHAVSLRMPHSESVPCPISGAYKGKEHSTNTIIEN